MISNATPRQIQATMQFHLRVAAAYEAVGKTKDAQAARKAAARLGKQMEQKDTTDGRS